MTTIYGGSLFPTDYDSFSPALVDNVDEVMADHPNTALEAVENIEGKLGKDGDPITGLGGVSFDSAGKSANPGAAGVPTLWVDNTAPNFKLKFTDELGTTAILAEGFWDRSGGVITPKVSTDRLRMSGGTVSLPGFAFNDSTGSGLRYSGGTVGISVAGTEAAGFASQGIRMKDGSATWPCIAGVSVETYKTGLYWTDYTLNVAANESRVAYFDANGLTLTQDTLEMAGGSTRAVQSTSGNLTVQTVTSGTLWLKSAGALNINGVSGVLLDSNSNDISFIARGAAAITFNQAGKTDLSEFTDRSVIGALKELKADISSFTVTLDAAYDSTGSGAGRTITADSGAVVINVPGGLTQSALEVNQNNFGQPSILLGGSYRLIAGVADASVTNDLEISMASMDASEGLLVIGSVGMSTGNVVTRIGAVSSGSGSADIELDASNDLKFLINGGTEISFNTAGEPNLVGFGSTTIIGALNELKSDITDESLWDRSGTVLSPQNAGDLVQISSPVFPNLGLSFVGDPNTGVSQLGSADTLAVVAGGSARLFVQPAQVRFNFDAFGYSEVTSQGVALKAGTFAEPSLYFQSSTTTGAFFALVDTFEAFGITAYGSTVATFGLNVYLRPDGSEAVRIEPSTVVLTGASSLSRSGSLTVSTVSSGTLVLSGAGGVSVLGNSNEIDLTTSGAVDINSGAGTWDASSLSLDATGVANLNAGASSDLTLGARGATITLNQSGDESLSGFDPGTTSLVGALNELRADVTAESLWNRSGTVLSPQTAGDTIQVGAGAVGAPGVAIGSANDGLYQVVAGQVGFSSGGTQVFSYDAGGIVLSGGSSIERSGNIFVQPTGSLFLEPGTNSTVYIQKAGTGNALEFTGAATSYSINATSKPLTIKTTTSGLLTLNGASGVSIAGNAGEIDLTTSGAVDINSGAGTWDASSLSLDATGVANLNAGASSDLTLGARGASLTFNTATDTVLSGFTKNDSLVGALNELKSEAGAWTETADVALAAGDVICADDTNTSGKISQADNNASGKDHVVGVCVSGASAGGTAKVKSSGKVTVTSAASQTWACGDPIYLDATAGRATNVVPTSGTRLLLGHARGDTGTSHTLYLNIGERVVL